MFRSSALALAAALSFSAAAQANYPVYESMSTVRIYADQAKYSAEQVYRSALQFSYGGYEEQEAVARLNRLEIAAEFFDAQIDSYYQNPSLTEESFIELNNAFTSAQIIFYQLSAYSQVQYQFNSLTSAITSLRYYYFDSSQPLPYPVPIYPRPVPVYPYPRPVYPYPGPIYPTPVYPGPGHYPGQPNPPAYPVYPAPVPYYPAPYNPGPYNPSPYNPQPYHPAPAPYNPAPYNPGHTPGQPNPPAHPVH